MKQSNDGDYSSNKKDFKEKLIEIENLTKKIGDKSSDTNRSQGSLSTFSLPGQIGRTNSIGSQKSFEPVLRVQSSTCMSKFESRMDKDKLMGPGMGPGDKNDDEQS